MVGVGLVMIALTASIFLWPASTSQFHSDDRMDNSIAEIVRLDINGSEQFIILRGWDATKPVMLFLHGGPGTPETPFIRKWNPGIEDHVVLAMWEQRSAGKSFSSRIEPTSMTSAQFIEDAHEVTQYLKTRFGKDKILLAGHSWGTYLGIRLISRFPLDYSAYIGISQTAHAAREGAIIHDWLLQQAVDEGNEKAIRALNNMQSAPQTRISLSDLSVKLKWVNQFGGAAFYNRRDSYRRLVWAVITCNEYTMLQRINYPRGESFTLRHMYDEIADINLFEEVGAVEVPIFLMHGRHDYQVPMIVAQDYFEFLQAPRKEFYIFENSAHGVLIEEPEKFNAMLEHIVEELGRGEI